jgi:hypothetical protein
MPSSIRERWLNVIARGEQRAHGFARKTQTAVAPSDHVAGSLFLRRKSAILNSADQSNHQPQ